VAGYEVLSVLGRGAMGVVYKARQRGLKRVVALKMILSGGHASEREMVRFRTEAEAVAQLQHPNIVQIYEVGEENGLPFFSLEFVEGDSLAGKINGTPQPPKEAARISHLLAGAMQAAHDKGIIHRDLKPANILMTTDGQPKITDFGLAKKLEEDSGQTHSGTIIGTPSYMPPEQAEGRIEQVGPLADVYSLGAVFYELLTGRVPFKAPSILETLAQVRLQEPVAPTQLQPKVPRDLETICLKCLQKDPKKRYASSGALAEDLRRYLNNEPILARRTPWHERTVRWCYRHPLRAALIAGMVVWGVTMSWLYVRLGEEQKATEKARIEAEDRKAEAERNWKRAEEQTVEARSQQRHSTLQLTRVAEEIQKKLRGRRFLPEGGVDLSRLADDILAMMQTEMVRFSQSLQDAKATTFGTLDTYQHVGDVLKKMGKGEEALRHFQRGHELAQQMAREQPDSDKAKGNLSIMIYRLGDMELELRGDARSARDFYQKARNLQQEVIDNPKTHDFSELEGKQIRAHTEVRLGKADLELGQPAAAREHFQEAAHFRKAWLEAEPNSPEAISYLSECYLWLGVAGWHMGDAKGTREAFDEAIRLTDSLVKKHAGAFWFKEDLAEILGHQGDAQMRLGQEAEAEKNYRLSWDYLQPALQRVPEEAAFQSMAALTHERQAGLIRTDRKAAETHFREALRIREEFARAEPANWTYQAAWYLTLAHSGRHEEAAKKADNLARLAPKSAPLQLQVARCYAACAVVAPEALRAGYTEKALGALKAATRAGYKDLVSLRTDPDLALLRDAPAYRTLLEGLAAR
jgi:serine/threonine-protein kinase